MLREEGITSKEAANLPKELEEAIFLLLLMMETLDQLGLRNK